MGSTFTLLSNVVFILCTFLNVGLPKVDFRTDFFLETCDIFVQLSCLFHPLVHNHFNSIKYRILSPFHVVCVYILLRWHHILAYVCVRVWLLGGLNSPFPIQTLEGVIKSLKSIVVPPQVGCKEEQCFGLEWLQMVGRLRSRLEEKTGGSISPGREYLFKHLVH